MTNYNTRFSGPIGEEYRLFKKSVPHHEEFQDTVCKVLKNFAKSQQNKNELKVIEAGCGTGYTTIRILNANLRIKVIAVDNEGKMIKQAKKALHDLVSRIEFKKEDILTYLKSVRGESADAFVSAYTIHNFQPKYRNKVFNEIARVLRKGGLFVNADKYARDNKAEHKKDLEEQIKAFDVYERADINRPDIKKQWTRHYFEDEKTKITEREQKEILEKLEFENIQVIFRKRMEAIITAFKK